jgi:hypothetical protein
MNSYLYDNCISTFSLNAYKKYTSYVSAGKEEIVNPE